MRKTRANRGQQLPNSLSPASGFDSTNKEVLRVYRRFSGGSNYSTLGDRHLGDLLKSGWDQIEAAQLGKDEVVSLAVGDSAVLLRLTLPPEMEEAAGQVLPAGLQQAFVPVLYELRLGRRAAKP